jgi:hypothetical protein
VRTRVGTPVNGQNPRHGVRRKRTVGDITIKGLIELPMIPQGVDHSDVEVGPAILDYNILEPGNDLVLTLDDLEDQSDLFCLLVRQFAYSPNNPFPYLFSFPVGFSYGVGLVGLSFIGGGTVAQMHDIASMFLRLHYQFEIALSTYFFKVFSDFSAIQAVFFLRLQYPPELRKPFKNRHFVKNCPE